MMKLKTAILAFLTALTFVTDCSAVHVSFLVEKLLTSMFKSDMLFSSVLLDKTIEESKR